MSNHLGQTLRMIACATAIASLSGCTSFPVNLVHDDRLLIQVEGARHVSAAVVGVYQKGETLVASGRVWRTAPSPPGQFTGHIDIKVVSGDGTVRERLGVAFHPFRGQASYFRAEIEDRETNDGRILVRYHQDANSARHGDRARGASWPASQRSEEYGHSCYGGIRRAS